MPFVHNYLQSGLEASRWNPKCGLQSRRSSWHVVSPAISSRCGHIAPYNDRHLTFLLFSPCLHILDALRRVLLRPLQVPQRRAAGSNDGPPVSNLLRGLNTCRLFLLFLTTIATPYTNIPLQIWVHDYLRCAINVCLALRVGLLVCAIAVIFNRQVLFSHGEVATENAINVCECEYKGCSANTGRRKN